jgi:2-polyprenyl-6-methoxyphenol hydroxylase-like FAD-dependent oxidoreductase
MPGHEDSEQPLPVAGARRPLRVLVIGAGVSGISVARGLLWDGRDVTVVEQRSDTRAGCAVLSSGCGLAYERFDRRPATRARRR